MKLEPEIVAHLRWPEGEGRGMSWFTFHTQLPPPLPPIAVNEGPMPPPDGASAVLVKEEADHKAAPASPGAQEKAVLNDGLSGPRPGNQE